MVGSSSGAVIASSEPASLRRTNPSGDSSVVKVRGTLVGLGWAGDPSRPSHRTGSVLGEAPHVGRAGRVIELVQAGLRDVYSHPPLRQRFELGQRDPRGVECTALV